MSVTSRVVRNARKRGVKVVTRKRWSQGARGLAGYQWRRINRTHTLIPKRPVDTVVQHITVTRPSGDFRQDMRTIHDIGMSRFGSGVSYNFVVDMTDGTVGLGQSLDAAGTHTVNDKNLPGFSFNQNYVSIAIAVLGLENTELSPVAKLTISRLIAACIDEGVVTTTFDYMPHSAFAYKDCPCDNTRKEMPDIRIGALRLARDSKVAPWGKTWKRLIKKS